MLACQVASSNGQSPTIVLPAVDQKLVCNSEQFRKPVDHVHQSDEWARFPRDLESVELFAGVGSGHLKGRAGPPEHDVRPQSIPGIT